MELVCTLHLNVQFVALAEALDLLELGVIAVDQDKILWLGLDQELLERVSVHAGFQGQIARTTLDMDFNLPVLAVVDEGLSVLGLQVFEPVVGLHVFLFLDHVSEGLLHLDPFMLVQD